MNVIAVPTQRGAFTITYKDNGYQARCPFHRRSEVAGCKNCKKNGLWAPPHQAWPNKLFACGACCNGAWTTTGLPGSARVWRGCQMRRTAWTRPPCFLRELIIEPPCRPLTGPLGGRRRRATCLPPFQALGCQQMGMTAKRASLRIPSRSLQLAAATSRANAPNADGGDAEKLEADEGDGASQFNPALLTETQRSSMFGMEVTLVLRL